MAMAPMRNSLNTLTSRSLSVGATCARQSSIPCRRSVTETCREPLSLSGTIRRFSSADQQPARGAEASTIWSTIYANRCHQRVRIFRTMPLAARWGKTPLTACREQLRDDRHVGGSDPPAAVFFYSRDRGGVSEGANLLTALVRTSAAFGPNHDPSRLDRDRGRRRNRLLRCHHDRHKHGRLVRRQRQLAAPRRLAPGKEMLRADLMPACHLRHDRARRKRFRDDPPLVRVTPPSPATNATANLDAPSRRGSVNYMVDHICEPMPSTGSHLPNYAARCKMGENTAYSTSNQVSLPRRSTVKLGVVNSARSVTSLVNSQ